LGNSHAHSELAVMYRNGEGMPVDLVQARVHYARAIALGESENPALLKSIQSKMTPEQLQAAHELIKESAK
jgi:TPR repeat protein